MILATRSGSVVGKFRDALHATRSRSSPDRRAARYDASAPKLRPLLETPIIARSSLDLADHVQQDRELGLEVGRVGEFLLARRLPQLNQPITEARQVPD